MLEGCGQCRHKLLSSIKQVIAFQLYLKKETLVKRDKNHMLKNKDYQAPVSLLFSYHSPFQVFSLQFYS